MSNRQPLGWAIATDPDLEVLWESPLHYVATGIHYGTTDPEVNPELFEQWQQDTNRWLDALNAGEDPTEYENTLGIVAVYPKEETNANDDQ